MSIGPFLRRPFRLGNPDYDQCPNHKWCRYIPWGAKFDISHSGFEQDQHDWKRSMEWSFKFDNPRNETRSVDSAEQQHVLTHASSLDIDSQHCVTHCVTHIEPGAFSGLASLYKLEAQRIHTKELEANTFGNLTKLRQIDLKSGRLKMIKRNAFQGLALLKTLDLSVNVISVIEPEAFSGLPSVTRLYMQDNALTNIGKNSFYGLTSLVNLELARNRVATISSGAFYNLISLKILSLGYNQIGTIEKGGFSGLGSNLTNLGLSVNRLPCLKDKDFESLENLQFLLLDSNRINQIEKNTFEPLVNLKMVRLTQNQLETVEARLHDSSHRSGGGEYTPMLSEAQTIDGLVHELVSWSKLIFACKNKLELKCGRSSNLWLYFTRFRPAQFEHVYWKKLVWCFCLPKLWCEVKALSVLSAENGGFRIQCPRKFADCKHFRAHPQLDEDKAT